MKRYEFDSSERDTMREMTRAEMETYYIGNACPFCGASALDFLRGPMGGLSQNIECPRCACRLNVLTVAPRGVLWLPFGQVLRDPLPYATRTH